MATDAEKDNLLNQLLEGPVRVYPNKGLSDVQQAVQAAGYAIEKGGYNNYNLLHLTDAGRLFIQDGGYAGKAKQELKKKRKETIELVLKIVAAIVAIAGLIAGYCLK